MATYAKQTEVSVSKSKTEIDQVLRRYGIRECGIMGTETQAAIIFSIGGKRVQVIVHLPDRRSRKITHTEAGYSRNAAAQKKAFEQAEKQTWRALVLYIKAGLEAVEAGIRTVEEVFFYDILTPNGQTIGQMLQPELDQVLAGNPLPPLLPAGR